MSNKFIHSFIHSFSSLLKESYLFHAEIISFLAELVNFIVLFTFQSLHLKIEPENAYTHLWPQEMLLVLEKFFDTKVAAPPYRPNHLTTFTRILLCPIEPLKDIVSILRYLNILQMTPWCKMYWLNYWHILISKGTSGFTSAWELYSRFSHTLKPYLYLL